MLIILQMMVLRPTGAPSSPNCNKKTNYILLLFWRSLQPSGGYQQINQQILYSVIEAMGEKGGVSVSER